MQLHNVQEETTEADAEHEVQEDGLLRGSGHKAVGSVWTRVSVTAEKMWHLKSKEVILSDEKDDLHDGAQENVDDVDEQHLTGELGRVLSDLFHFLIQLAPLLTLILLRAPLLLVIACVIRTASLQHCLFISSWVLLPFEGCGRPWHHYDLLHLYLFILGDLLQDVDDVENRGRGDEDNLEDPEAQV